MRLDKRLKEASPDLSWRQVREAIEKGQVSVDGRVQRDSGLDVFSTAKISLDLNRPAQVTVRASFDILHEDEHVLVLNKPAGLLSIPSSPGLGSSEDTVLRRVREYMAFKRGHKTYVGMLHRLDRDTSGSLAVALSKDAHAAGREMFKHHKFERHYLALVQGIPDPPSGTIDARISTGYRSGRRKLVDEEDEGLEAATDYLVRERLMGAALLELRLHTGRQHQIRLHLESSGTSDWRACVPSGLAAQVQGSSATCCMRGLRFSASSSVRISVDRRFLPTPKRCSRALRHGRRPTPSGRRCVARRRNHEDHEGTTKSTNLFSKTPLTARCCCLARRVRCSR